MRPLVIAKESPITDSRIGEVLFRFHLDDNVCERRLFLTPRHFDRVERAFLCRALPEGGRFVDIGANAGLYSMLMASHVGPTGRVVAIEPQAEVFDRLLTNIRLNGFENVTPLNVGVSDRAGALRLFKSPANRGAASVCPQAPCEEAVTIRVEPLLKLLTDAAIDSIDALKIDVERHEDAVMAPFIRDAHEALLPKLIVTENSRANWKRDWIAICHDRGYRVVMENRRNIVLERLDHAD